MQIAFYMNFHNDAARLRRAVASIRRNYRSEPIFVYDDWSLPWNRAHAERATANVDNLIWLRTKRRRAGWAGYHLVQYELLNFIRISRLHPCDYIFKLDTDTLICQANHERALRFGGDIVGNSWSLDPCSAVFAFYRNHKMVDCMVMGGGYFIKSSPRLMDMLRQWRGVPRSIRDRCGPCHEDQSIATLCWLANGKVVHSPELEDVRYWSLSDQVGAESFAIHPVKEQHEHDRLLAQSPSTVSDIRISTPDDTRMSDQAEEPCQGMAP